MLLDSVFVRASIAMVKDYDQIQLLEDRVISAYSVQSITQRSQGSDSRQEVKQRTGLLTTFLFMACSACFF